MNGPLSVKDIMMLAMNPLYPGHVDTNYQQISGGYMNAAPTVPTQPYQGMDMHMDTYQGSDAAAQEQFAPSPEPDFQEIEEEMAQMGQMEEIPYDSGLNAALIETAFANFFQSDTLEDMIEEPDMQRELRMFLDSF